MERLNFKILEPSFKG